MFLGHQLLVSTEAFPVNWGPCQSDSPFSNDISVTSPQSLLAGGHIGMAPLSSTFLARSLMLLFSASEGLEEPEVVDDLVLLELSLLTSDIISRFPVKVNTHNKLNNLNDRISMSIKTC